MGQDIIHDVFTSQPDASPKKHQLFTKRFLGASRALTVEAVGLRINAAPDIVALVAPSVQATLVVDGLNQTEFPRITAAPPVTPPAPAASADPSPDDVGADDAQPSAPPAPEDDDNYVIEGEDPFSGEGQAKFVAATGEIRGLQSYGVTVTFAGNLWSKLGNRQFELVAYLVGRRHSTV